MRTLINLALLLVVALWTMTSCGSRNNSKNSDTLPYSPYVEAFTSGNIPRATPVYVMFNQEVLTENMTPEMLKKAVKIRPEVEGEFSFENSKTIAFKPKNEFDRNTTYSITADMSQLFGAEGRDKEFRFKFTTLPVLVRANMAGLDINDTDDSAYDVKISVYTPDREASETIEPLIKLSEKVETKWEHSTDGKRHDLVLSNVPAGKSGVRVLNVSVNSNKLGIPTNNILSVSIPGVDEFGVYDATYVTEPERYIEVTFNKLLDEEQQMHGLAYIRDNKSENVTVEGNKLRLYPDSERTGVLSVGLDAAIKSSKGVLLGKNITREVEISSEVPAVRFVGNGVIIPQSSQIIVPFQAVYLRGVVVRVIKITEQNIGQFLQNNTLDGYEELIRVGRVVARKTIFLDEIGQDLSKWGTYAVDLKEIMQPEQGAIYRVELSYDQDLSAYPCDEPSTKTKEQILASDEIKLKEEESRFDAGGYYYYYDDYNWYDYNYYERSDPCKSSFYTDTNIGRNVLASNLGLIAKGSESGEMLVMAHNLISTGPENGVLITIHNFQNQVIGQGTTDIKGHAHISLKVGSKPFYVIAVQGKQRSYLRIDDASSLSLSTFDVSGEVVQKGIKGYIYGDRGVWRPGDVMYLSFMLGDKAKSIPVNHPVVMELYNPLGQLHSKKTQTKGMLGLYAFEMPTDPESPTGAWNVKVTVGGVTFSKRVRVEAIKPNRLKIDMKFNEDILLRDRSEVAKLHVEWMQGATARNLKYEIDRTFTSIPTQFENFKGYVFEDPTKSFDIYESSMVSGQTDEQGNANVEQKISIGNNAPGMMMANMSMRVYEESGEFSIDATRIPFSPYNNYVGIKSPQKGSSSLNTGDSHTFELASVDYKGNPVGSKNLEVKVYKVTWYWWWSSSDRQMASYISKSHNRPVKELTVTTKANGKASFNLSFTNEQWGTYYISVYDRESGHSAGLKSYFDWGSYGRRRSDEGGETANTLKFELDKNTYKPGEKMAITLPSSVGSRAVVTIENGSRVLMVSEHDCVATETKILLDVTEDMQPNAYVYVSLLQPHGIMTNDLPIRMYGVEPITVTSPESRLLPVLTVADDIKPESKYDVVVSETNGREMAYTLAIVDEGLLDLTRFKTPDPWGVFNAREALGVRSWDMYNYVMGAYGGRIEQMFSIGGDAELESSGPKAIVNRFKPVVRFEGPFVLKRGAKQKHTLDMPNYNGRVRVMVVAGDGSAYGNAQKSVMVRKPVMLLGTLPRVIGIGEEMVVPANIFATEKGVGSVKVSITCSDNMTIMGASTQDINFSDVGDKQAFFRIKVGSKPGAGRVVLTAVSKNDKSTYETDIEVRSVYRKQVKVSSVTLDADKSWNNVVELPGMGGTNKLTLEVSNVEPINLASRLEFLLGYPHGCMEQITSKGFPQLFLKEFASLTKEQETIAEEAIKEVLRRQRSYQIAEGAFAYWPGGTSSHAWATIYATHFQLEAEAKGYLVQKSMSRNALNNLSLVARNWKPVTNSYYSQSEELTQAYRLYVLALAKKTELGAMNRMKESKNLTQMSRWTLAAAYAKAGRVDVAKSLVQTTVEMSAPNYGEYDYTFGSDLRDKSMKLIALVLIDDAKQAAILTKEISKILSSNLWLSTQSTAFALVALSQYMAKYKVADEIEFSYTHSGKTEKIKTKSNVWSKLLLDTDDKNATSVKIEIKNTSKATMFVRVITEGTPDQGEEEPYANGLLVSVTYLNAKGEVIDITELEQGTNFVAVATIKNPTPNAYNNITLSQIFPAGWEILNTRFMDENAGNSYPAGVNYQDIRDDRVYSYVDRLASGRQVMVRINLAAVYAGVFYCPPVFCEAMYDNLIRANTKGINVVVKR